MKSLSSKLLAEDSNRMRLIVITPEDGLWDKEIELYHWMFENGLDFLHLRKPHSSIDVYRAILDQIDKRWLNRIVIHDHYTLVDEYALAGWHLNDRNASASSKQKAFSASSHSLKELHQRLSLCREYCFLSPIFDSISKDGYYSAFDLSTLRLDELGHRVVALGGIDSRNLSLCRQAGFSGIALLGYIWGRKENDKSIEQIKQSFESIRKFISN